jgi:hypothetical protein
MENSPRRSLVYVGANILLRINTLTANQIVLRKEAAWSLLPLETRQRLYELLPTVPEGCPPHDPNVHPLKSLYQERITAEFKWWQDDLKDGKETKRWREEALQAGHDRSLGLWDDWKEAQREATFRKIENDENGEYFETHAE